MSIRDLLVSSVILGSLPICFIRPWIGILVWSWIGYMNPHRMTWGFAYSMPFAQIVSLVTVGGMVFTKDRYPMPLAKEVYLLLALWGIFLFSTWFAIYPEDAWRQFSKVSKILFMTFLTLLLFQDLIKLRLLIWVIVLSIGFFGLKGGIWAVVTGGQNMVLGPPDSFIAGNTNLGLALNMVLPFLFFLRREVTRRWLRHLLLAMFGFSAIATLITYSRGAFLGLVTVLLLLSLKSRAKLVTLLLLAVCIPIITLMVPEMVVKRMETIQTYEEDISAMSRLQVWQLSYLLALDHPFLGGGFEPFSPDIYRQYLPNDLSKEAHLGTGAHSIYFQVLAEHGFTGLILYVGLILSTMMSLRWIIRKSCKDRSMQSIYNYAQMIEVSLFGYLVSGIFLSMCYFDLFYHLVAIVVILKKLILVQEREAVQTRSAPDLTWPRGLPVNCQRPVVIRKEA